MKKSDIGLIGLAVMGENLVMNMESHGFQVSVFNRTTEKVTNFVEGRAKGKNIVGTYSLEELVESLEKPRKVMMMVKAGEAVDQMIEKLLPLLEDGDIIIDGGNSHFPDTARRTAYVESKGKLYIGTGVSGGEEGALKGPSLMPGGSPKAWPSVKPILQAICAKVEDGSPCCDWVGENGAGHFVKMVHNGIEYGDMQLICEAYQFMKDFFEYLAQNPRWIVIIGLLFILMVMMFVLAARSGKKRQAERNHVRKRWGLTRTSAVLCCRWAQPSTWTAWPSTWVWPPYSWRPVAASTSR